MVGTAEGWSLDPLLQALLPYESKEVVVEFPGYRAKVRVNTLTTPDETEKGFGDWLVDVQQVLEEFPDNPYSGRDYFIISLDPDEDTPLRVSTVDGEVLWEGN